MSLYFILFFIRAHTNRGAADEHRATENGAFLFCVLKLLEKTEGKEGQTADVEAENGGDEEQ